MTVFQIIILLFIVAVIAKSGKKLVKKEISIWLFAAWLMFWLIVLVVDLVPGIINRLADMVGVGRGVDLVVYISLLVLFYFAFRINIKINKLEKKINETVRQIALSEAKDKIK